MRGHVEAGDAETLVMRRRYRASIEDVWDACTDPRRLAKFFMKPVGDFNVDGKFEFEGNAHGEVLRCEPPELLRFSWIYGSSDRDEVEIRLSPEGAETTVLELEHASTTKLADSLLNDPETGMWGRGTGWELGLIAMEAHLCGEFPDFDLASLDEDSPEFAEAAELADRVGEAWAKVLDASEFRPRKQANAGQGSRTEALLANHLRGRSAEAVALFDRFVELVERAGSFTFVVSPTTVGFKGSRRAFAGVQIKDDMLKIFLDLRFELRDARVRGVKPHSGSLYAHEFLVAEPGELGDEFAAWVDEAFEVGEGIGS
ncbi:SRPBCC family protein [Actinosynnema sp. ALI-1.44]|uniref:SRPBCC family protein n=1 Tax=Actinosynnema sp. ALI-1.44 TaxID=1933779 RepID=UPI00143D154C|nr:SRPBCC family protein [Actinosynnema sp. ALI-1.44]